MRASAAFVLWALLVSGTATASDEGVSFQRQVLPILRGSCQACHQPGKKKGELDLTTHASMLAGGASGPVLDLDAPRSSVLLEMVRPVGDQAPAMPDGGEPLSEEQVSLLERWIAEGAKNDAPTTTLRFDADRPPTYPRLPVVTSLAFSPDGSLLAVSGYHEVLLHSADGSALLGRLIGASERVESIAFSPDGGLLAVAGGTPGLAGELQVWEVAELAPLLSLPVTRDSIYGASWSPDGTRVAFGCGDNTLRVVDVVTGREVLYQNSHEDWVLDTCWSLDASHVISVSRDRSMKLVKVETQQFIDNITSITPGALRGGLLAVARHPERDELLIGGADGEPKVFRMFREKKRVIGDDFNLIRALEPLDGRVFDVAFSADGARIFAVSSARDRGQVRAYAAEDGATLWTHDAGGAVFALAVRNDGVVAAAGFDGRVTLLGVDGVPLTTFDSVPLEAPHDSGADSGADSGHPGHPVEAVADTENVR